MSQLKIKAFLIGSIPAILVSVYLLTRGDPSAGLGIGIAASVAGGIAFLLTENRWGLFRFGKNFLLTLITYILFWISFSILISIIGLLFWKLGDDRVITLAFDKPLIELDRSGYFLFPIRAVYNYLFIFGTFGSLMLGWAIFPYIFIAGTMWGKRRNLNP